MSNDNLKNLPESEQWAIKFMGLHAHNLLKEKLGEKTTSIQKGSICGDGRREPTVRKALHIRGLIESPWYMGCPIQEIFEKEAPTYATTPEFEIKGRYTKASYGTLDLEWHPHESYIDGYRKLNKLTYTEHIYVYLHQEDYEIIKIHLTSSRTDKYFRTHTREWDEIKIFPKALIKKLQKTVCKDKILYQARKHLNSFLEISFDRKFKTIKRPGYSEGYQETKLEDTGAFKIEDPINKKEITKRIQDTCSQIRYMKEVLNELRFFRKLAVQQDFEELLQNKAEEWMTENSPLHINSDNEELKELAKAICKGENFYE